jgi:hypothetical protein
MRRRPAPRCPAGDCPSQSPRGDLPPGGRVCDGCQQNIGGVRTAPPLGGGKRSSGPFSGSNARERFRGPGRTDRPPQSPLGRNQGANAPPARARPPPGRARLRRLRVELRWEGLRDKVPKTAVGAPSRGRAWACVGEQSASYFFLGEITSKSFPREILFHFIISS